LNFKLLKPHSTSALVTMATKEPIYFDELATEIVLTVFYSCNTIRDAMSLAQTCHRFQRIFTSSQRLLILESIAETQYGPLADLTQLLTHNASQPAHIKRKDVPFSQALLTQIVRAGNIADKWADIYPFKKWKVNFEDRRLLTNYERKTVRKAVYRLWLYSKAFHNRAHPRETRCVKTVVEERAALLHNWSTPELAEMADVHSVIREVLHSNVCPSNGTIARKFKKRYPDTDGHLLFNIHLNYPPPVSMSMTSPFQNSTPNSLAQHFHNAQYSNKYANPHFKYTPSAHHEPGAEGWGDDIPHYYVIEDMLKLDPEQIMWLKEHAPLRAQVEQEVNRLGRDWFDNNGETWCQTLEWVLDERGEEVEELLGAIIEGGLGVAVGSASGRRDRGS
jgi:hypothetical protein